MLRALPACSQLTFPNIHIHLSEKRGIVLTPDFHRDRERRLTHAREGERQTDQRLLPPESRPCGYAEGLQEGGAPPLPSHGLVPSRDATPFHLPSASSQSHRRLAVVRIIPAQSYFSTYLKDCILNDSLNCKPTVLMVFKKGTSEVTSTTR